MSPSAYKYTNPKKANDPKWKPWGVVQQIFYDNIWEQLKHDFLEPYQFVDNDNQFERKADSAKQQSLISPRVQFCSPLKILWWFWSQDKSMKTKVWIRVCQKLGATKIFDNWKTKCIKWHGCQAEQKLKIFIAITTSWAYCCFFKSKKTTLLLRHQNICFLSIWCFCFA